jgi:DNA-3-methyladenine glycosylase
VTSGVLPVRFFHRPAAEVARDLLGAVVVSRIGDVAVSGRIIETEAYLGYEDPASHAYRGRRHAQNQGIYSHPGSWYVYRSYGVHWCANLVCAPEGLGAAVLLRALEPLEGIEVMRERRKLDGRTGRRADGQLCDGPGKLCQALGITKPLDGQSMPGSPVALLRGHRVRNTEIAVTPRVGITRAVDWPLRFAIRKDEGRPRKTARPTV